MGDAMAEGDGLSIGQRQRRKRRRPEALIQRADGKRRIEYHPGGRDDGYLDSASSLSEDDSRITATNTTMMSR